jgi:hypothetical protein
MKHKPKRGYTLRAAITAGLALDSTTVKQQNNFKKLRAKYIGALVL